MQNTSPFLACKQIELQLKSLLRSLDVDELELEVRRQVTAIRQLALDVRLDARDYELSETRAEQLGNAVEAKKRLEQLRIAILAASQHNVFSVVDVAQLTAQLDQINGWLI